MVKLVVKKTNKYGKGVFSASDIKKGEVIKVLKGRRLDVYEVWSQILSGKIGVDYPLQIGRRTHIILDPISRLFNHSCEPNAAIRKNSELFALRDIRIGQEITFDYSLTCAPTDDWSMRCFCGSKICRHVIGDILTISKTRLEYYQKEGALQTYMKRLLPDIIKKRNAIAFYDRKAISIWNRNHAKA